MVYSLIKTGGRPVNAHLKFQLCNLFVGDCDGQLRRLQKNYAVSGKVTQLGGDDKPFFETVFTCDQVDRGVILDVHFKNSSWIVTIKGFVTKANGRVYNLKKTYHGMINSDPKEILGLPVTARDHIYKCMLWAASWSKENPCTSRCGQLT